MPDFILFKSSQRCKDVHQIEFEIPLKYKFSAVRVKDKRFCQKLLVLQVVLDWLVTLLHLFQLVINDCLMSGWNSNLTYTIPPYKKDQMKNLLLFYVAVVHSFFVYSQQTDTVIIDATKVNTRVLNPGVHRYLVYFKNGKDSSRKNYQLW